MNIRPRLTAAGSVSAARAHLTVPLDAYRPIPWWAWTADSNEPDMLAELDRIQEQGINEFFLSGNKR